MVVLVYYIINQMSSDRLERITNHPSYASASEALFLDLCRNLLRGHLCRVNRRARSLGQVVLMGLDLNWRLLVSVMAKETQKEKDTVPDCEVEQILFK